MNTKSKYKSDDRETKMDSKKTAIVRPTIRPKQRSFNGIAHISPRIKKEELFSSLPNKISSQRGKEHCESKNKINIPFQHKKSKKHKANKYCIQRDELDGEIGSDNLLKDLVDIENNFVSLDINKDAVTNQTHVLTKPLLDIIDDLCSGASTNCDRKKLSHDKRRKSLSQERIIGIKQFFRYSKLWKDIKGL